LDSDFEPYDEAAAIKDHLSLPLDGDLDRILRYEASIQRQMANAINQPERLQRGKQRGARAGAGERSGLKRSIVFCRAECDRNWGAGWFASRGSAHQDWVMRSTQSLRKLAFYGNEANKSFVMNNSFRTPTQLRTDNWRIRDDWSRGLAAARKIKAPTGRTLKSVTRQAKGVARDSLSMWFLDN
jgi:hypothetical protein